MKRIGKIIMSVGVFISVTGACALDSEGLIYSTRRIRFNLFGRFHSRHKEIAPFNALASRCDS